MKQYFLGAALALAGISTSCGFVVTNDLDKTCTRNSDCSSGLCKSNKHCGLPTPLCAPNCAFMTMCNEDTDCASRSCRSAGMCQ